MIYRLRKKFIRICMCSFLAVFVVLFGAIFTLTSGSTSATVFTPASAFRAASTDTSVVSESSPVAASRSSNFAGVSNATSRPWAMMRILSQIACTSERMCELRMTVCDWPRLRIRSRISMI